MFICVFARKGRAFVLNLRRGLQNRTTVAAQISFSDVTVMHRGLEKRKLSETTRPSERKGSMSPTSSEIPGGVGGWGGVGVGRWPLQGDPFYR